MGGTYEQEQLSSCGAARARAKKSEWPLYKLTIQRQLYKITIEAPAQCRSLQSEHTAQGGDELPFHLFRLEGGNIDISG